MASSPGEQVPQAAGRRREDENVVTRLLRNLVALFTSLLHALFRSPSEPTSSSSSGPQDFSTTSGTDKNNKAAHHQQDGGDKDDIDLEQGRRPTSLLPPIQQHDLSIDMAATRQYPQQAPAHAVAIPRMPPGLVSNGHGPGGGVANKENLKGDGKQKPQQHQPAQLDKGIQSLRIDDANQQHDELPQTLPPISATATEDTRNGAAVRKVEELDPVLEAAKVVHRGFMHEALEMARLALRTNETPVGCVLVYKDRIIAKGMNATNVTRNGTRHAELMAISALMSYSPASDTERAPPLTSTVPTDQHWGDVDPRDGHLYPYGQKLHPAPRVSRDIISECVLYVTVEPCVMCASLLRQLRIKKVYFGAVNDKFGGTGGVFRIHKNSTPLPIPTEPVPRPVDIHVTRPPLAPKANYVNGQPRDSISSDGSRNANGGPENNGHGDQAAAQAAQPPSPPITAIAEGTVPGADLEGDGGNVELGYDVEGGWGRDEAVNLLRQFYVQENGRAPVPRKKEGRAARLAAMMEKEGMSTEGMSLVLSNTSSREEEGGDSNREGGQQDGGEVETNGAVGSEAEPELVPSAEVQATSREEMSPGGGVQASGRVDGGD